MNKNIIKIAIGLLLSISQIAFGENIEKYSNNFKDDFLKNLESRIEGKEKCNSISCASINEFNVIGYNSNDDIIKIKLKIYADIDNTFIYLPLKKEHISVLEVVDNQNKKINYISANTDNSYLLAIPKKGIQEYTISAKLLNKNFSFNVVEDIIKFTNNTKLNVSYDNNILSLSENIQEKKENKEQKEIKVNISDYFVWNKTIYLDKDIWKINNTFIPYKKVIQGAKVRIPLMKNESLISNTYKEDKGFVEFDYSQGNNIIEFETRLKPQSIIQLEYVGSNNVIPVWRVLKSNFYEIQNIDFPGFINKNETIENTKYKDKVVLLPFNGEKANISIKPTKPFIGKDSNIDAVYYDYKSNGIVEINSEIRTSLGYKIKATLLQDLKIENILVNGVNAPYKFDNGVIEVELKPGTNQLNIKLNGNSLSSASSLKLIEFNQEVDNSLYNVEMPKNSFVAYAWGTEVKPSFLIWGYMAFAVILGIVLARSNKLKLKAKEAIFLCFGLSVTSFWIGILIVFWLYYMQNIKNKPFIEEKHNKKQLLLISLTVASILSIIFLVSKGLLYTPEMYISGINSHSENLFFYSDNNIDTPKLLILNIWIYKAIMLIWSFWLSNKMIDWIKEVWLELTKNQFWIAKVKNESKNQEEKNGIDSDIEDEGVNN